MKVQNYLRLSAFIGVSFLIAVAMRMINAIIYNLCDHKNEQC